MNEDYDGRAIQARPAAVKADGKYILKSPNLSRPFFQQGPFVSCRSEEAPRSLDFVRHIERFKETSENDNQLVVG